LSRNKINTGSHVPKIQKRAVKNTAIYTKILIFVTKNNGGSMIHTFFKKSFGKKKITYGEFVIDAEIICRFIDTYTKANYHFGRTQHGEKRLAKKNITTIRDTDAV